MTVLTARHQGTSGCASLQALLHERLIDEHMTLLLAQADGDELQMQISQDEIDHLRAVAARHDIQLTLPAQR